MEANSNDEQKYGQCCQDKRHRAFDDQNNGQTFLKPHCSLRNYIAHRIQFDVNFVTEVDGNYV